MAVPFRRILGTRVLPLAAVLVMLLSGNGSSSTAPSGPAHGPAAGSMMAEAPHAAAPAAQSPYNASLVFANRSVNLSSLFWGTNINNEVHMFRGETDAVNATPTRVLVFPGAMAGEDYNPLTNTHYDTYSGEPKTALTNESQFVDLCKATHCTAIMQLPAEIDDPALAEAIVNYTEVNLSFTPAFWMIGNEPELWSHWKVPWKDWPTSFTPGPTPTQFGYEVLDYVKAIRAVDNTTPILGLPASGCTCGYWTFDQWIYGVLKVTGDKIQAVAFHEYPAGWLGTGNGSLQAFYQTIQSAAGIPTRMVAARAAVQSACPGCNVSVWVSEIGAALSWSAYGPYAIGFSGSLSLASQMTQAMDVNLTNVDLFATELATTNSWFDPKGNARADYTLYTGIFKHLGSQATSVNITGLGHTLYATATNAPDDQGRQDLLVVNDDLNRPIAFEPRFATATGSSPVEAWSWNGSIHNTHSNGTTWVEPYTPNPIPQEFRNGLPGRYVLPPQSLVLFESYPGGGTYVRVHETGVPSPTAWYASVGPNFYTTSADNISLMLPAGSYPMASVGIPLPIGGHERHPSERLGPIVDSPLIVSGSDTNTTIDFTTQWRVDVTASPSGFGTVEPSQIWWNDSEPLNLTATPATGYALAGWSGWGPGSVNGSGRWITVVPTGRVFEKARFVPGDPVEMREWGLPLGTEWSVTVRQFTTTSADSTLTVYEPPGTYGFSVNPVPGFRCVPTNGSFTVDGSPRHVDIQFLPILPAPVTFPVTFRVSGLPDDARVSITVRDTTQIAGAIDPQFQLLNGLYAYHPGYVAGYRAAVPQKTFAVSNGPVTVDVPFVPSVYKASWIALGARFGMGWSVLVNGTLLPASSAWVSVVLPNGSYPYTVLPPANFSASPQTGVLGVTGFSTKVYLFFNLVTFPTWFEATGPGSSSAWTIRFGNQTLAGSAGPAQFLMPNGTYTFNVHPPSGYYAVPSHGKLTVTGSGPPLQIQFHPSSQRPSDALVAKLSTGALVTSGWIGVSFFVGFAALRGFRRRSG